VRGTRFETIVIVIVLTAFAILLIAGHSWWSGEELLRLSTSHGINSGDLVILAAWATGVGAAWRLRWAPRAGRRGR
jgi:hypothetical protein